MGVTLDMTEHKEMERRLQEQLGEISRLNTSISQAMLKVLRNYDWPGNVRELENVIERAVIVSRGSALHSAEPLIDCIEPNTPARENSLGVKLDEVEAEHIRRILRDVGWRIGGQGGAAELLGLNPSTLRVAHGQARHPARERLGEINLRAAELETVWRRLADAIPLSTSRQV